MAQYRFHTTATMKPYNNKKWWIDHGIVRPMVVEAESVSEALETWRDVVRDEYCIGISKTAMTCKEAMYKDDPSGEASQVGYVITGSCDFCDDVKRGWSKQYIELWVEITEQRIPIFDEAA